MLSICQPHSPMPVRCAILVCAKRWKHTQTLTRVTYIFLRWAQLYNAINTGKATTYFNGHDHTMAVGEISGLAQY